MFGPLLTDPYQLTMLQASAHRVAIADGLTALAPAVDERLERPHG